jgi:hypothetical protein
MKIVEFHNFAEQVAIIGRHEWSVARLVQLSKDFPVMNVPLNHLSTWKKYDITLRELAGHVKAVLNADLSFPIILDEDNEIMDGRHRLIKAMIEGHKTIKAVRFEENPDPCRVRADA